MQLNTTQATTTIFFILGLFSMSVIYINNDSAPWDDGNIIYFDNTFLFFIMLRESTSLQQQYQQKKRQQASVVCTVRNSRIVVV